MDIDLVIFDCDGVLIDSEIISARMLVESLATMGVTIDLPYVSRHFLGRSYPTVMAQIRREFGLDLPEDFEDVYRARLLAAFERELTIMPGVRRVIDRLARPYCVATSSSPKRVEQSFRLVGLEHLLGPHLFTSTMVARGKPAPDLFLHAAQAMGAEPGRCLVIEDSLNGVKAGLAAGMVVWQFTGGSHLRGMPLLATEGDDPALRFDDFAQFFALAPELERT
ncbi:MAG: HAD family hydrolase [Paracoccaceae bacterium]